MWLAIFLPTFIAHRYLVVVLRFILHSDVDVGRGIQYHPPTFVAITIHILSIY
jgi:hypothetical protein